MSIFDPRPSYRTAQPYENARIALDTPLSPLANFGAQFQQGALDSFGLGTVIKDFSTPRGAVQGPGPLDALRGVPLVGELVEGYEGLRSLLGTPTTGKALPLEEWKASEFYRDGVTWDAGMTSDRAAAIATQFDIRQARQFFGQKDMLTTLAGGFAGGAMDPINYVPVFGQAARAAAVTRFGAIAGHGLLGASEAAINTAAFGLMTAPFRGRLGEDVSWEASINNIAFSAIAGAVFGGIGGVIAKATTMRKALAERNVRGQIETIKNLQDSRDMLNDAIGSLVAEGDVKLSPKYQSVLERIAADATDRRVAAGALERETADVVGDKPGEVTISPSGARVAIRPEVVELSTLQKASGVLQVRDRSAQNAASNAQIQDIALKLDPAKLMPSIDASQGAPLVGGDNIVDSGNGRVAAIDLAYGTYPERAAAYRQALIEAGYPEAAQMERPVLISRRLTELSTDARAQFNADVNGPTTARMSAVELAAMDRNALTDSTIGAYDFGRPIAAASNREFVSRFMQGLPLNERTGLVDRDGNLAADGLRRIENALMAAAYGDVDALALRKFAEATDDNTRSIVGALVDVAGKWIALRRAIQRGDVSPEMDMTPELTEGLRMLSRWRDQAAREGRPVSIVIKEGMAQGDMLSGSISGPTKLFVRTFYANSDFTQAAGRDVIAGRLNDLVDEAMIAGQPDMLGEAYAATKLGVLKRVYNDLETDFLEATDLRTGTDESVGAGRGFGPGPGRQGDPNRIGSDGSRRYPSATPAERAASTANLKASQPDRSFDELYAVADQHQAALDDVGKAVARDGVEWRNPGVKTRATAEEKMARKGYDSTREITDVVRGGFVVKAPADAEDVVSALARRFRILDEGWNVSAAGYFDRKVMVQFDDGTVGEVQIWHPDMLAAKEERGGHKLYEQMRDLKPDDPKFVELLDAQRALYLAAIKASDEAWMPVLSRLVSEFESKVGGMPASGKAASNSAGDNGLPESMISAAMASRQSPPDDGLNQAPPMMMTAGRPSQSKNVVPMREDIVAPTVDMQEPRPEPAPDGLDAAASRVGRSEDIRALAEQFGVDAKTGDFDELVDIDMLRSSGRLTPEDEALLAAADEGYANAQAYSETLRAAAACVMG